MLALRVVTALILAPTFLAGLFGLSNDAFAVFLGLFLLFAAWEWGGLCGFATVGRTLWTAALLVAAAAAHLASLHLPLVVAGTLFWGFALVAVAVFPAGRAFWERRGARACAGVLMMLPAWAGLVLLQGRTGGPWLVTWTVLLVVAADIGAYFAGHAFGRRALAPDVSPGKTIEGLAGGVLAALVISVAFAAVAGFGASDLAWVLAVSAALVGVSVLGDLMESLVKRVAGVKDSGSLLPGHGGILDRVDAVLAAAPVSALLLTTLGVVPGGWLAGWPT